MKLSAKSKRGRREGDGKKMSRQFAEEWWGWNHYPRQSLGIQRPSEGSPPPTTSKPSSPCATSASSESDRRERAQRNNEGHRHSEPAQCTDAGLVLPRESYTSAHNVTRQSPRRLEVFRKPAIFRLWLCCMLLFSSPGSRARTDATRVSWPATGALRPEARRSLAPGDDLQTHPLHAVPTLRCSEHASTSMPSSKPERWETSPRCINIQKQIARPSRRCETKLYLSGMRVPGTSLSNIMTGRRVPGTLLSIAMHAPQATTSDMCSHDCLDRNMPGMKAHLQCHRDMPGMRHEHSLFGICSHVGYNKSRRLATCPGQCAHVRFSRFETCPGQCAHSSNSRSATCPGQCARSRYSRLETCPGQRAPELYNRNQTCSEQLCRQASHLLRAAHFLRQVGPAQGSQTKWHSPVKGPPVSMKS